MQKHLDFIFKMAIIVVLLNVSKNVYAKDEFYLYPIEAAFNYSKEAKQFDKKIPVYFNFQNEHPRVERLFLDDVMEAKTVAILQKDVDVCQKAFKDAIISLQKKAKRMGADALINVQSFLNDTSLDDKRNYECAIGDVVGKVVLYAELVTFDQ